VAENCKVQIFGFSVFILHFFRLGGSAFGMTICNLHSAIKSSPVLTGFTEDLLWERIACPSRDERRSESARGVGSALRKHAAFEFSIFAQSTLKNFACSIFGEFRQEKNFAWNFMTTEIIAAEYAHLRACRV